MLHLQSIIQDGDSVTESASYTGTQSPAGESSTPLDIPLDVNSRTQNRNCQVMTRCTYIHCKLSFGRTTLLGIFNQHSREHACCEDRYHWQFWTELLQPAGWRWGNGKCKVLFTHCYCMLFCVNADWKSVRVLAGTIGRFPPRRLLCPRAVDVLIIVTCHSTSYSSYSVFRHLL